MSSNITYYVSVDSQYRDDSKYPLETDFGVKFKPSDFYATYPDQSFFYPEIAELYENTGAYNPPGLAPNPATITGSGIVYPKGQPLQSDQVYPRITIDKNYIDSPIEMIGGYILQMKEVGDTIYLAAITNFIPNIGTPVPYNNWAILVNGQVMYQQVTSTTNPNFQRVIVATVKRVGTSYTFGNCLAMSNDIGVAGFDDLRNQTFQVDMHINTTLNFCYLMFDFKANQFVFRRVPGVGDLNTSTSALPLLFKKSVAFLGTPPALNLASNQEWSNVMIVGFSADLTSLYSLNNAPWGYHQFYSYSSSEMMPTANGYNQMLTDEAGNIYAAVHCAPTQYSSPRLNPTGINAYEYIPGFPDMVPLISNVRRTVSTGIKNSKPLASVFTGFPTQIVGLCSRGTNFSSYDTYLQLIQITDYSAYPPTTVQYAFDVGGVGSLISVNDATFFSLGGNNYFVCNAAQLPFFGLRVFRITGVPSVVFTAGALSLNSAPVDSVEAVDAVKTDVAQTPGFNDNIAVAAVADEGGSFMLYLYEFNGAALLARGSAAIPSAAYMVKLFQSTNGYLYVYVVTNDSYLRVYYYNGGLNAPVLVSSTYIPTGPVLPQNEGQCSHIEAYSRTDGISTYDLCMVAYDEKAIEFRIALGGTSASRENPIANSSTYNLHFETNSLAIPVGSSTKLEYLMSSNQYSNAATNWNMTLPNKSETYQVGKYFTLGPQNLWFFRDSGGRIFGFTRSETTQSKNRFYMSIAPFITSIPQGINILSEHTTKPQNVLVGLGDPSFTTFPDFPVYLKSFEDIRGDFSKVQQVYVFATNNKFAIYDVEQFPFYTTTNYPWPFVTYGQLPFTLPYVKFTNVDIFVENSPFSVTANLCMVANNGLETAWISSFNYGGGVAAGSLGWGFLNPSTRTAQAVNVTTSGGLVTIELYNILFNSPAGSFIFGPAAILNIVGGAIITFQDDVVCLAAVYTDTGFPNKKFVRFINLINQTVLAPVFTVPQDSAFTDTHCSTNTNPLVPFTNLFIDQQVDANGSSSIVALVIPTLSTQIASCVFLDGNLFQQFMQLGSSSDAATSLVSQSINSVNFLASYTNVENLPTLKVSYYDTTANNNFKLVAEYDVDTGSNTNQGQVVKIGAFTNRTLLLTLDGAGGAFPGPPAVFGTLSMLDISNPEFAATGSSFFSLYDGFGVGTAVVSKVNNDGVPGWGTFLGDRPDVLYGGFTPPSLEPSNYSSQGINVTGIELDPQNLNLYASVDWQTKIMVRNYQVITGSQRLVRYSESSGGPGSMPSLSNSSLLKLTTSQGYSQYIVPILGTESVQSIDLSVTDKNVVVGENLQSLTTVVYEKQTASYNLAGLTNPVVTEGVLTSPTPYSVALVSFDFDGNFEWSSKAEIGSPNSVNVGLAMAKTNNVIYLSGFTNSNLLNFKDTTDTIVQSWTNDPFYTYEVSSGFSLVNVFTPNTLYNYVVKYSSSGAYLESDFVQTDNNAAMNTVSLYVDEVDNVVNVVSEGVLFENDVPLLLRNKDGTLGDQQEMTYQYVYNSTTYDVIAGYGVGSRYKLSTATTDVNGKEYSYLTVYKDVQSTGPVDLFEPYLTGTAGIDFTNRHVYIPQLNQNFLIRSASYNAVTNEFVILLNQKIPTNIIDRTLPATIQYPVKQATFFPDRYDTLFFYIANISTGETSRFGAIGTLSSTAVFYYTNSPIDLSKQYYFIDSRGNGDVFVLPTSGIVELAPNAYAVFCNALTFLIPGPGGRPTPYAYLSEFNANALYTLQFYPAALNMVEYYTVALQNLTIPNRDIRESTIPGVRTLSDFRYVWLEIYNANDADVADTEFVNNTFSNNPNRNNKVIFQIPVTSAGGGSNFSFYGSGQTARIKFNPGFYNLRIRLLDPNGNVVLFDSTPASNNSGDAIFTTTVDPSLMNITVDLALTKYSSF